jgi:hypothetical protein
LLSTEARLAVYYLGFGFVALLGWAAIAQDLSRAFDQSRRQRWDRLSAVLSVAGLVHPALPVIGLDIARQAARDEQDNVPPSRFITLAMVCAVASVGVAGVVIAVTT